MLIDHEKIEQESLDLAYETSMKTYEWALKRIDTWDGNLDKILTLGAPVLAIILGFMFNNFITLFKNPNIKILGILNLTALVTGALLAIKSILTILKGKNATNDNENIRINFASPEKIWNQWVIFSKENYQYNAIKYAQEDFDNNLKIVNKKSAASDRAVRYIMAVVATAVVSWVTLVIAS
jgi:hypothetical protein